MDAPGVKAKAHLSIGSSGIVICLGKIKTTHKA
jgi:hypothetical protein